MRAKGVVNAIVGLSAPAEDAMRASPSANESAGTSTRTAKTRRACVLCSLLISLTACAASSARTSRALDLRAQDGPLDAIVVLGHRPPLAGATLEYETRARVERGITLYGAGRAPWLLFSGGPSTPRAIEADVMASDAEQHGVPSSALLRERASRDTIENARLSVLLLREKLALQRRPRVLLVTSDYHVDRAARLFRCAGADVLPSPVSLRLSDHDRARKNRSERWVRFYYFFIDECGRARAP